MKNFLWRNYPWLLLALLMVILMSVDGQAGVFLEYQRQAILDGQVYRLLTGHLVHINLNHTLLNLVGLSVIGWLSARHLSHREWWTVILVSALCVSGGLILFDPNVQWYRGMSGVLHGALVLLVLRAHQFAGPIRGLVLVSLVIKLLLEQMHSGFWQSEQLIGTAVIVDAHLYGVIGGVVSYLIVMKGRLAGAFVRRR